MEHFADRLTAAVRTKGNPVCVGIDPRWELLPAEIRARHDDGTLGGVARAYQEFGCRLIDVIAPLVAVVKPQSAFFEACGPHGMAALQRILAHARRKNLLTIFDGKRNDIAATAEAYANAAFTGFSLAGKTVPVWDADASTVNPYLGRDAVEPFLESARRSGRGVFILVRNSNPGARQFQDLICDGKPLFEHVALAVGEWTRENVGKCGYGDVGAVVGATYPEELKTLRGLAPNVLFLIPGYGTQGGGAPDAAPAFREDGLGAVVNNSRGLTFCYKPDNTAWEEAVAKATQAMIDDLRAIQKPS